MPIGSEKSDDAESDNHHEGAKSDHNEFEHGHDAPEGSIYSPRRIPGRRLGRRGSRRGKLWRTGSLDNPADCAPRAGLRLRE